MRQTYARLLAVALILFALALAFGFAVYVNSVGRQPQIPTAMLAVGNMQAIGALLP